MNVRTTIVPANSKSNVHPLLYVCNTDNGMDVQNKGEDTEEAIISPIISHAPRIQTSNWRSTIISDLLIP